MKFRSALAVIVLFTTGCGTELPEREKPRPSTSCSAATCAGCCLSTGVCQVPTNKTCGLGGKTCLDCSAAAKVCSTDGAACVAAPMETKPPETTPGSCTEPTDCPSYACTCPDGAVVNSRYCQDRQCQSQDATCANACRDHQVAAKPDLHGCSLTRYASDLGVTGVEYGTGTTEVAARNAALTQCRAANWTEAFCAGGTMTCALEAQREYKCTFSRYAQDVGVTATYYGEGTTPTAGRAAAIQACLDTGEWKGWFCTSGTVTCAEL